MVALHTWCVHDVVRVAERDMYAPPQNDFRGGRVNQVRNF